MDDHPMIEVVNLTKRYAGYTAVEGLSLAVGKGEIVGFLGPNGAGKSTLLKTLAGELAPLAGTLSFGHHAAVAWFAQH